MLLEAPLENGFVWLLGHQRSGIVGRWSFLIEFQGLWVFEVGSEDRNILLIVIYCVHD